MRKADRSNVTTYSVEKIYSNQLVELGTAMITNQQIENMASNASNHVNTDLQNEEILKGGLS